MHHIRMMMVMLLLAAGVFLGSGSDAVAQNSDAAAPVNSCSEYVGVSNRIVMCMRESIAHAAAKFYDPDTGMYNIVRGLIGGFLTLVVIVYGILAAYGMLEKPGRDIMILMLKLSLVTAFVVKSDLLYETTLDIMDNAAGSVVDFTPSTGPVIEGVNADRVHCLEQMHDAAGDPDNYSGAWLSMDCILDSVIGIKTTATRGNQATPAPTKGAQGEAENSKLGNESGMARGLIRFFFSSMQSSILGVLLAIVGFVFMYSLLWLIIKALLVYLVGYLGIAFMMILAPIFIPLILFRVTSEYFRKWAILTIAFAMQPIIILAFVSFAVAAIDLAMFSGDYSVMYRIAGEQSRQSGFNLNKYLDENKIIKRAPTTLAQIRTDTKAPDLKTVEAGIYKDLKISDCDERMRNSSNDPAALKKAMEECASYPVQFWRDSIDWKVMAQKRQPAMQDPGPDASAKDQKAEQAMTAEDRAGRQISREVFASIMFVTMVILCINGLMTIIPAIVNDLVGESFQSPNLANLVSRSNSTGSGGIGGVMSRVFNRSGGGG